LFCFTSHSEGQPIASLEILAEGRPIIATAVGAFPNMLTLPTLGATVPTHDTAAFVAAVRGMIAAQKAGRVNPQASVEAYRTKFDRDAAFRRYLEILSLDGSLPELGRKTPDVSLDPAIG
jgi:glycosyltransferase involved in cell wall biosynthesis